MNTKQEKFIEKYKQSKTNEEWRKWRKLQNSKFCNICSKYDNLKIPITSSFIINTELNEEGKDWIFELASAIVSLEIDIGWLYGFIQKACDLTLQRLYSIEKVELFNAIVQKIKKIFKKYLEKFGKNDVVNQIKITTQNILDFAQIFELTFEMQSVIRQLSIYEDDFEKEEMELRTKFGLEDSIYNIIKSNYDNMICCLFHLFDNSSYKEHKVSNYYDKNTTEISELFNRIIYKFDFFTDYKMFLMDW